MTPARGEPHWYEVTGPGLLFIGLVAFYGVVVTEFFLALLQAVTP